MRFDAHSLSAGTNRPARNRDSLACLPALSLAAPLLARPRAKCTQRETLRKKGWRWLAGSSVYPCLRPPDWPRVKFCAAGFPLRPARARIWPVRREPAPNLPRHDVKRLVSERANLDPRRRRLHRV